MARSRVALLSVVCCFSLLVADIPAAVYWRTPFVPLCDDDRHLTKFLVLDVEISQHDKLSNSSVIVADVWASPIDDLTTQVHCKTHLGHIIHPGDTVLGYVLTITVLYTYTCTYNIS